MTSENQLEKPRKNEKRIGEDDLKKIIESDTFYSKQKIADGGDIFYFHELGDYLKGVLLSRQTAILTNYKTVTYKMEVREMRQDSKDVPVKDNQVVEFSGLKYLRRVIDKNELIGSTIRIVYVGRQRTGLGHSAKVFDVFKITGISSEKESYQDGSKRGYNRKKARTSPKSGAARLRIASGRTR